MPAVVLDIEPDRGHRQAQRHDQRQGHPPRCGEKHQQRVRRREPAQNNRGFEVHSRAIAGLPPDAGKILIDAASHGMVEFVVAGERQAIGNL